MLDKKIRRLLTLLVAAIVVSILIIVINLGVERLQAARIQATQFEKQLQKLEQSLPSVEEIAALRDRLKKDLDNYQARYYTSDEMNPFSFGTLIKKKLVSLGITVNRYQLVELGGASSLEFSVSGSARSMIFFLKAVSESEKYWTISSLALTMRAGGSTMDAVFRIGYEILGPDSS